MDAARVIEILGLEPLRGEGGYFHETYRSRGIIPRTALSDGYSGERPFSTAIYFLVTPESFSALHRVPGEEIFHFYLGDPVSMFRLYPDGEGEIIVLGNDIEEGHRPQCVVPGGVWQGLRLVGKGKFALLGTTMSPGFEFEDFERGERDALLKMFPGHEKQIRRFTGE